jgi:polysaccharide biosynthesis/export protein
MLLAAGFQMQSKDVMYVTNARVVDYYKLLLLINNTTSTVINVNSAVHQVAAPIN